MQASGGSFLSSADARSVQPSPPRTRRGAAVPCKQGSQGRRRRHSICALREQQLVGRAARSGALPSMPPASCTKRSLVRAHAAGHARRSDRPVSRSHAPDGTPSTRWRGGGERGDAAYGVDDARRRDGGPDRRPGAGPAGPPPAAASNPAGPAHGGTAPHTRSPPSRRGRAAAG